MSIYLIIISLLIANPIAILRIDSQNFVEGSIVGVDSNGNLLGLSRINPLVSGSIQLERDISGLIYESLITIDQNKNIQPQLALSYEEIKPGNYYKFELRQDVYWHDGEKFTSKDVEATFNLLVELDKNPDTASSFSRVVANQFDKINPIDDYHVEIKLKDPNAVLPTFLESLIFKILPAAHLKDVDSNLILSSKLSLNTNPIGTGPFQSLTQSKINNSIKLTRNINYYNGIPEIESVTFVLLPDEESAVRALKTGRIHAIAGLSTDGLDEASKLKNYSIKKSNVIYKQYWALHFNLNQISGNSILMDKYIRKAIEQSVNRDKIISLLNGQGVPATSTIPENSYAYNNTIEHLGYNPEVAKSILNELGWEIDPNTGFRQKAGKPLKLSIVYVNNIDRNKVAKQIKADLEAVGIEIELKPKSINEVNNEYILPRSFDILLYGQTTFVDEDRFELYHSSQIDLPENNPQSTGLNISSYKSNELGVKIIDKETVDQPKVDILLEQIKAIIDKEKRAEKLFELQEILEEEQPTVFLYHPIYSYVVNDRLVNVDLTNMNNLDDRFGKINKWSIHK